MKNILSLAFALLAIFGVGTAFTVSPAKWAPTAITFTNTCFKDNLIRCHIAGLGDNQGITVRVLGAAECFQKNNTEVQHAYFDRNFKLRSDKNGNVQFETEIRPCPGGFRALITSVDNIEVYDGDKVKGTPLAESGPLKECNN